MSDIAAARRTTLRWHVLVVLNAARPYGASEALMMEALRDLVEHLTPLELRRELGYLEDRDLITIASKGAEIWKCELTRHGVDVAEYTVECDPGVARPPKYWTA